MIDLGSKNHPAEISAPSKDSVHYPSLSVTTDKEMKLPAGKFAAMVHLMHRGGEWTTGGDGKKRWTHRFDVHGMQPGKAIKEAKEESGENKDAASAIMESLQEARNKKIESEEND